MFLWEVYDGASQARGFKVEFFLSSRWPVISLFSAMLGYMLRPVFVERASSIPRYHLNPPVRSLVVQ